MAPSPIGEITMKTVLITGATGNIGRKLRTHLEAAGKYTLRLLCLNPGNDPTVHTADLSTYDQDWAAEFGGVDTVLHVAADPSPRAGWARIQSRNIDLLLNVLVVAHAHSARRVVFASSNFVVAGHRFGRGALTTTWSRRRSTPMAPRSCLVNASARCLQNVTVPRSSPSASAYASAP